jgi:hypothetical protein
MEEAKEVYLLFLQEHIKGINIIRAGWMRAFD